MPGPLSSQQQGNYPAVVCLDWIYEIKTLYSSMKICNKKQHPCVDCGEVDPRVLQFDHVIGVKKANVSSLAYHNKASKDTLLNEIAKCMVRCANCHVRKTWDSLGYFVPEGDEK